MVILGCGKRVDFIAEIFDNVTILNGDSFVVNECGNFIRSCDRVHSLECTAGFLLLGAKRIEAVEELFVSLDGAIYYLIGTNVGSVGHRNA